MAGVAASEMGGTAPHRDCVFFNAASVRSLLPPPALLHHLRSSLPTASSAVQSPLRQQFPVDPSTSSSLLLMPSWSTYSTSHPYIGVKIVTSFPHNSSRNLPGVHASYILFHSLTGATLAAMDGTQMTLIRTAAISALAADYLAREEAHVLVMVGAGALAAYIIRAHLLVRPSLRRVIIWNRTADKSLGLAKKLAEEVGMTGVVFEHAEGLDEVVGLGDMVSCATSSEVPLVKGERLKPGAHLDLVGSFTPLMKECDEEALVRAKGRIFVDNEAALEEAGELVGAVKSGVLSLPGDLAGRLLDLITGAVVGRRSSDEITIFKSVGSAVVDLLTAQLAYETYLKGMSKY